MSQIKFSLTPVNEFPSDFYPASKTSMSQTLSILLSASNASAQYFKHICSALPTAWSFKVIGWMIKTRRPGVMPTPPNIKAAVAEVKALTPCMPLHTDTLVLLTSTGRGCSTWGWTLKSQHLRLSYSTNIWPLYFTEPWFCCCSVGQYCPTLCKPMNCSTPGFPVLHPLPELAQTRVHWVDINIY